MREFNARANYSPRLTVVLADVEDFAILTDGTLFSRLASVFENGVVHLLSQQEVPDISNSTLRKFQESYASTAFRCRYPNCARSSMGFSSAQLRSQHESNHFQRVYCKVATCHFGRVGFPRKAALCAHTRKYHAESTTIPIPPKIQLGRGDRMETSPAPPISAKIQQVTGDRVQPQIQEQPFSNALDGPDVSVNSHR